MPISPFIRALRDKVGHDLLALQSATVVVFDEGGRMLLAQDTESGLWMTIGGAIEPGETPPDAAVRECYEEAGLLVKLVRLIGVFGGPRFQISYANGDIASYVAIVFEGCQVGGTLRADGSEARTLRYVTQTESTLLPMAPWTADMVARAFDRRAPPYFASPSWRPPPETE